MTSILTVTPNPSIDLSASVDHVVPTRKLRSDEMRRDAGGGGINVARVARRMGADVTAVYTASGIMGRLLQELVEAEDVVSVTVPIQEETRENFTALETATGEQYRFVLPGPCLSEDEWRRFLETFDKHAAGAGLIVASGSLPPGVPDDFYARIADTARARDNKMFLDVSGQPLKATLKQGVYLAKPNLRELCDLVGKTLDDDMSRIAACRDLIADGGVEVVALTLGDQGALLVTRDGAWRAEPLAIEAVSIVGAGDSFVGAMAWAMANGHTLHDAFRYGCAAGSATALSAGTELCNPADVMRLAEEVVIQELAPA